MIGIFLDGRMGNQMFQYAFALTASKKLKTPFYLDQLKVNFMLAEYFELPSYHHFYNSLKTKLSYYLKQEEIIVNGQDHPESVVPLNSYLYKGYFQSDLFFESIKKKIKQEFTIKKKYSDQFKSKYGNLFKQNKTIVIHIRLTDYLDFGNEQLGGTNLSLPEKYFKTCLNSINGIDNYQVLFISDDITQVKKWFSGKGNFRFESNNAILDFQLILNSDIAIISNSSFAWWAAYLNPKSNKIIYTPKYWLGFKINKEFPAGIIPSNWNTVIVRDF